MKQSQLLVASILIIAAAILPGCARSDPAPATETVPPPRHTNMVAAIYPGAALQNAGLRDDGDWASVALMYATDDPMAAVTAWYTERFKTWAAGKPLTFWTIDNYGTPLTRIGIRDESPLSYPDVMIRVLPEDWVIPYKMVARITPPIKAKTQTKIALYGNFPRPRTALRSAASEEEIERFDQWLTDEDKFEPLSSALGSGLQVGNATLVGVDVTDGPQMGTAIVVLTFASPLQEEQIIQQARQKLSSHANLQVSDLPDGKGLTVNPGTLYEADLTFAAASTQPKAPEGTKTIYVWALHRLAPWDIGLY